MTKEEAATALRKLTMRYGLHWGPKVPQAAYDEAAEINKVLNTADRRAALGLQP